MDKLQMAQDYIIAEVRRVGVCSIDEDKIVDAWKIADAMQAEADKRKKAEAEQKRKEIREMLNAPNTFIEREGQHFNDVEGCEVDWRVAPDDAVAYIKLSIWDVGAWIDVLGIQIENAPSFGFTGTHIVERPHGF